VVQREVDCSNIRMFYWQPDPVRVLAEINYSDEMHEQFGQALRSKIDGICIMITKTLTRNFTKRTAPIVNLTGFATMNGLILRPWKMMKISGSAGLGQH